MENNKLTLLLVRPQKKRLIRGITKKLATVVMMSVALTSRVPPTFAIPKSDQTANISKLLQGNQQTKKAGLGKNCGQSVGANRTAQPLH